MGRILRSETILTPISTVVDNASIGLTWEDISSDGLSGSLSSLTTALTDFFNTPAGAGSAAASYISSAMSRASDACRHEIYDITGHLDGTPHGAPIAVTTFTLAASNPTATLNLPEGVAATVSFRAEYGADVEFVQTGGVVTSRPRARDRNRFYLGPLNNKAFVNETTTNRSRLNATFVTDILDQLHTLSEVHTGGVGAFGLRVWSRKAAAVKLATQSWMDDRPDYQRRRTDPNPASRVFRATMAV